MVWHLELMRRDLLSRVALDVLDYKALHELALCGTRLYLEYGMLTLSQY